MLPAGAPGGWLYPAKLSAALPKYRELLRAQHNTRSSGCAEDSSSLFLDAKARVLHRLRERRAAAARVDPRRAFARLQGRWAAARLTLRDLKEEQKARLKQYVASAVGGGGSQLAAESSVPRAPGSSLASGSSAGAQATVAPAALPNVAAVATEGGALDAAATEAVMGSNGLLRHLVLAGVGGACKVFLATAARTSVSGREHMAAALERAPGRGLLTVSNHVGSIDDPLITASIVPASRLLDPPSLRWTLCATDRCFRSAALAPFFRAAKVLPVERGGGLAQHGMRIAQSRLAAGEWVHIFPEGTRSRDGRMLPVRKGVGWLVASSAAAGGQPPLVLPFVHGGMERVLPKGASLPRLGQELRVLVGEPVEVQDLLATAEEQGWAESRLQAAIADRVGQALYSLKAQLDGLPLEEVAPQPRQAALTISEDTLLPLIEDEMDSLAHSWRDRWQYTSLPSFTQRARAEAAARRAALRKDGVFGASSTFEDIAAATEEAAGMVSSWEHDGSAPAPWAAALAHGGNAVDGAGAPDPGSDPQLGMMLRQKLRLLRGSLLQATVASPGLAVGSSRHSSQADSGSWSPLDAVASRMKLSDASSAAGATLQGLLASAADYTSMRVQHMRELLLPGGASPAAAQRNGSPVAPSAA